VTMTLLVEFFEHEFNDHIKEVLELEFEGGRFAYLTFNIFNVRIDPENAVVVLEDELDPSREETVDLSAFSEMVARGAVGHVHPMARSVEEARKQVIDEHGAGHAISPRDQEGARKPWPPAVISEVGEADARCGEDDGEVERPCGSG